MTIQGDALCRLRAVDVYCTLYCRSRQVYYRLFFFAEGAPVTLVSAAVTSVLFTGTEGRPLTRTSRFPTVETTAHVMTCVTSRQLPPIRGQSIVRQSLQPHSLSLDLETLI